jgi:hypothetical protein
MLVQMPVERSSSVRIFVPLVVALAGLGCFGFVVCKPGGADGPMPLAKSRLLKASWAYTSGERGNALETPHFRVVDTLTSQPERYADLVAFRGRSRRYAEIRYGAPDSRASSRLRS